MQKEKEGVLLLSGGLDSTALLAYLLQQNWNIHPIHIQYGQTHSIEALSAIKVAEYCGLVLEIISLPLKGIVRSALLDGGLSTDRSLQEICREGVPSSYVPARNTIFLALAAGVAESRGANVVFYAGHRDDHVGYPDCTPQYVDAISIAIQLGTTKKVCVQAPFINLLKADIIKLGSASAAPLHLSHSCYQGKSPACGVCDTCRIRLRAFEQAGVADPIEYESRG